MRKKTITAIEVPGVSPESVQIILDMRQYAAAYAEQQANDRRMQTRASLKGCTDSHSRRDYFLTFCRAATADERDQFAKMARIAQLRREVHVLVEKPRKVPSLYGSAAVNVLVHRSSGLTAVDLPKTFHGRCGHSTFVFACTGEVIG